MIMVYHGPADWAAEMKMAGRKSSGLAAAPLSPPPHDVASRVVIAILWFSYHYHYHGYHLTLTITDDTPPPYHSVPKQYLDAN